MRIIGHLDMDAFFAAIEERNNPRFAGQPIAVGADPRGGSGRGVLSTANYKARDYGLHSAMPVRKAWELSEAARQRGLPPVIFLSGGFSTYGKVSHAVMRILVKHTPHIQKRSVDEAYFDLTHTKSYENAKHLCQIIKNDIQKQEQLTASIGIGPNKLIAKIASDHDKPDGLTVITEENAEAFLEPLPIRAIPGIGPKTESKLKKMGMYTVKDLKRVSQEDLTNRLGKWGATLYQKIRGHGSNILHEPQVAKSIGHNQTFFHDTLAPIFLIPKLIQTCEHILHRLTNEGFSTFRTVAITVRFFDFQTQSRAKTLTHPSSSQEMLKHTALHLFLPFLDARENPQHKAIRLIGVRLEKIT